MLLYLSGHYRGAEENRYQGSGNYKTGLGVEQSLREWLELEAVTT
jgi:hypothetical protein